MHYKNKILYVPIDKINISSNMVTNNVIIIKYKYDTDDYNKLIVLLVKYLNKYKPKIYNIKSVAIFSALSQDIISFTQKHIININTDYNNSNINVVKLELFVKSLYSILSIINSTKYNINLDIISSKQTNGDIINTITTNTNMIINISDIDNYIPIYFTNKIKKIHYDMILKYDEQSLCDEIINILKRVTSNRDLSNSVYILRTCLSALSVILQLNRGYFAIVKENILNTVGPHGVIFSMLLDSIAGNILQAINKIYPDIMKNVNYRDIVILFAIILYIVETYNNYDIIVDLLYKKSPDKSIIIDYNTAQLIEKFTQWIDKPDFQYDGIIEPDIAVIIKFMYMFKTALKADIV